MFGYHGCYLRVDLTHGTHERIPIDAAVLRRYVGGVGLGSWILHQETPVIVDALAPEAPLVFCFSPLVGTPLTTSAKFAVVAHSPLTGMLCDALSSSHFALSGKQMGVDALVFVGRCTQPSVWVAGQLEATDLWGCTARHAEAQLQHRGHVAAIGVAGENQVAYATISNDGRHAGRGGLGAVMGAKRLKAIVVQGDTPTPLADADAVLQRSRRLAHASRGQATAKYRELGTVSNLLAFNRLSVLPTRNFRSGSFEGAAQVATLFDGSSDAAVRRSCARCTIGCERLFVDADGRRTRMEYENVFALGPLCGIDDPAAILAASRLCDDLGLDTISAGGTLAFAMECAERGWLDIEARFGDSTAVLELLSDIAHRRGVGAWLAEGSRKLAQRLGGEAIDCAPQVKGLEMPGYEPRALPLMALGFAVGTRGADHNRSAAYEVDFSTGARDADAVQQAVAVENRAAVLDSLILCKFLRHAIDDLEREAAGMLQEVTGWDWEAEEIAAAGARIVNVRKLFNQRAGWQPDDDRLPARFLEQPAESGSAPLGAARLQSMIQTYNDTRGWQHDGWLADAALHDLQRDGVTS